MVPIMIIKELQLVNMKKVKKEEYYEVTYNNSIERQGYSNKGNSS